MRASQRFRAVRDNRPYLLLALIWFLAGCASAPVKKPAAPTPTPTPVVIAPQPTPMPPSPEPVEIKTYEPSKLVRKPDEIIVAGQYFSTGTRIVTWQDAGGYNAYKPRPGLPPAASKFPDHYGARRISEDPKKNPKEFANSGNSAKDLADLRKHVDQFVLHYDECGISRVCFKVLHVERGLSVHFMLDVDGTIYQTLDLKERAFHATTSNSRSIGIEIAHIGAQPLNAPKTRFNLWYPRDAKGRVYLRPSAGDPQLFNKTYEGRPARESVVHGVVQKQKLEQYDYTPEQYAALIKLTAALCKIFPELKCDYPRDAAGKVLTQKLPDPGLEKYHGILGHYHIQANKIDPGPALDWDKLITGARVLLNPKPPASATEAPKK